MIILIASSQIDGFIDNSEAFLPMRNLRTRKVKLVEGHIVSGGKSHAIFRNLKR